MLEPINYPKHIAEYRAGIGPLLDRIVELDRRIDGMVNSTEKNVLTKRRAWLWSRVLDMQCMIRDMEVSQDAAATTEAVPTSRL